jgi:hypothetical protein
MLWFERQVVTSLVADLDPRDRTPVLDHVHTALRSMPQHLRAGVAAESVALGAFARVRGALGRFDDAALARLLDRLGTSPIDPLRQWVRLLSSLVLFAREELAAGDPAGASRTLEAAR